MGYSRERRAFASLRGAYKEPKELAFPKKEDVDINFDLLTQIIIDGALAAGAPTLSVDGHIPPVPGIRLP